VSAERHSQTFKTGDIHSDVVSMGDKNVITHGQPSGNPPSGGEPADGGSRPFFGIMTALPEEFAAMRALLDGPSASSNVPTDRADYVLGTLPSRDAGRPHHAVLTMLGQTGTNAAADACTNLVRSFPSVQIVIMCGIACGVPNVTDPRRHVRLGDIVVASWGIVDYDHVTETDANRSLRQPFPSPSPHLGRRAKYLEAEEIVGARPWEHWIKIAEQVLPRYARPPASTDVVFSADDPGKPVPHPDNELSGHRPGSPKVHHGRIGSADRSLRSARVRDALAAAYDLRAIEMEGRGLGTAGFSNGLEWFMVRGISDYGDRRTNGLWRGYASIAAAAYVRALLAECPPWEEAVRVRSSDRLGEPQV
jgi:nucleoside phosphorylase